MKDVKKFAELSSIKLTPEEAEAFQGELQQVLEAFEVLETYPTQELPSEVHSQGKLVQRDDEVKKWEAREDALSNVPERRGDLVKVPPVI